MPVPSTSRKFSILTRVLTYKSLSSTGARSATFFFWSALSNSDECFYKYFNSQSLKHPLGLTHPSAALVFGVSRSIDSILAQITSTFRGSKLFERSAVSWNHLTMHVCSYGGLSGSNAMVLISRTEEGSYGCTTRSLAGIIYLGSCRHADAGNISLVSNKVTKPDNEDRGLCNSNSEPLMPTTPFLGGPRLASEQSKKKKWAVSERLNNFV